MYLKTENLSPFSPLFGGLNKYIPSGCCLLQLLSIPAAFSGFAPICQYPSHRGEPSTVALELSGNKHLQWPAGHALADAAQCRLYLWLCTLLAPSHCCAPESWCPSLQSCFPDSWTPTRTEAKPALVPKKSYIYT